jgi:hypothetical protein
MQEDPITQRERQQVEDYANKVHLIIEDFPSRDEVQELFDKVERLILAHTHSSGAAGSPTGTGVAVGEMKLQLNPATSKAVEGKRAVQKIAANMEIKLPTIV